MSTTDCKSVTSGYTDEQKIRYYNHLSEAIRLKSSSLLQEDQDWKGAIEHMRLAIKEGCFNDEICKMYLNSVKQYVVYFKDIYDKQDLNSAESDSFKAELENKVEVLSECDELIKSESLRWEEIPAYGIMTVMGVLMVLRFSDVKVVKEFIREKKRFETKFESVIYGVFRDRLESILTEELKKVKPQNDRESIKLVDISLLKKEWVYSKSELVKCFLLYHVAKAYNSFLYQNKGVVGALNDVIDFYRSESEISKKAEKDGSVAIGKGVRWDEKIELIRDNIEKISKISADKQSVTARIFQISLYSADNSSKSNRVGHDLDKRNTGKAIAIYRGLLNCLSDYEKIDENNNVENFKRLDIRDSYWYLIMKLAFCYNARLNSFVNEIKNINNFNNNFTRDEKNRKIEEKRQKYWDIIAHCLSASVRPTCVEEGFDSCELHRLVKIGESFQNLKYKEGLDKSKDFFISKIKNELIDALSKSKWQYDNHQNGIRQKFDLITALEYLAIGKECWNLTTAEVFAIIKAEFDNEKYIDLNVPAKILAAVPGKSIYNLKKMGIEKDRDFAEWMKNRIVDAFSYEDHLKQLEVARICKFISEINLLSADDRIELLKLAISYINDSNEKGKEILANCNEALEKLEELKEREKYLFSNGGNESLGELRTRHMPLATAAFWSLFDLDQDLKHLTHGGLVPETNTFKESIDTITKNLGIRLERIINKNGLRLPENIIKQIYAYIDGVYKGGAATWTGFDGNEHKENLTNHDGWKDWIEKNPTENIFDHNKDKGIDGLPMSFKKYSKMESPQSGQWEELLSRVIGEEWKDTVNLCYDSALNALKFYHGGILEYILQTAHKESLDHGLGKDNADKLKIKIQEIGKISYNTAWIKDDVKDNIKKKLNNKIDALELRINNPNVSESDIKFDKLNVMGGSLGNIARACCGYCDFAVEAKVKGKSTRYDILQYDNPKTDIITATGAESNGFTYIFTFYTISGIFKLIDNMRKKFGVSNDVDMKELICFNTATDDNKTTDNE